MSTFKYLIRRLFYVIPVLMGVSLIIFMLFNIVAGDPTVVLLGKHATAQQMAELRHELGLDKNILLQYLDVLKSTFTFDFGRSWKSKQQIFEMIKGGAYASFTCTVPAFFITTAASIGIAMCSAFYHRSALDAFLIMLCIVMTSISGLAYILFGQWFLAYKLGWFEISGYEYGFPNFIPFVLLPIIIWIPLNLGPGVRFYRTIFLDEMNQDYVRTANAKGLSNTVLLFKHVLKNAMIPIIANISAEIPTLIMGALLIESFFSIPGLGGIAMQAIFDSDFPVIKAITIVSSVLCVVCNVFTDILYTWVDPRIRLK